MCTREACIPPLLLASHMALVVIAIARRVSKELQPQTRSPCDYPLELGRWVWTSYPTGHTPRDVPASQGGTGRVGGEPATTSCGFRVWHPLMQTDHGQAHERRRECMRHIPSQGYVVTMPQTGLTASAAGVRGSASHMDSHMSAAPTTTLPQKGLSGRAASG